MNKIAQDMRYALPNQNYRDFVARYLLQQEAEQPSIDPFALDVPSDKFEHIYVEREDVENEISQWGNRIIVGPEGRGKTTLFRKLPDLLHGSTLTVEVPLQESIDGRDSPLAVERLAYDVFNAYWEDLLRKPLNRGRFLPRLRRDQQWMARLRWFYHRYRLLHPEIPEEFEFMAWLKGSTSSESFNSVITPEDTLRELILFVTSASLDQFGAPFCQPYAQIQILLDGTEHLPERSVTRLIQDARRISDLYTDRMQFKLFVDAAWQKQIETMRWVRQGRAMVYHLPRWNEYGLRQILHRRLKTCRRGEFVNGRVQMTGVASYDWGRLISDTHLEPAAQSRLVDIIVHSAMEVYRKSDESGSTVGAIAQERRTERTYLAKLRQVLISHFDEEDIRTLCFDSDVDYDSLRAQGKAGKARELVRYFENRNRISELVEAIQELRPNISWDNAFITGAPFTFRGSPTKQRCEDDVDAPIHVLRLARGLIAACAGCWKEEGYVPPLSLNQITELADLYWRTG